MMWMPFLCLAIGLFTGMRNMTEKTLKIIDGIINIALVMLMLTIGMNIGINDSVMSNLDSIGINCLVISLCAIVFSILFTLIAEKTVLPLGKLSEKLSSEIININSEIDISQKEKSENSILIWIMPSSIVIGVILGYSIMRYTQSSILDYLLVVYLAILYISVGISLGSNSKVFRYIRILGFRVVYISIAIMGGSLVGGFFAGLLIGMPLHISVMSASGMSYYSLTGAYMTQVYGIEAGTYGFVVNVMREFFTVLMLPLLVRISPGSPIAGGAAGNMDTMLVPVTKFVGVELGLITLITGVVLTFAVPFILPALYALFS